MTDGAPRRIVFAGTPDFALPSLDACAHSGYELAAVYTQPDRRAGRGRKPRPGPVKVRALELGVPVFQPQKLDAEARAALAALRPDLMVVVAYGLILPPQVLAIPPRGCVNVHASLLPRWRGAAPIQRAIEAGDDRSGVTLMRMEPGLDTGPVLAVSETPIGPDDTGGALHDRLAHMGGRLLADNLDALMCGYLQATPQDDARATYARKLAKGEARIDWRDDAQTLARRIRAFNPWPVAHAMLDGDPVRFWRARAHGEAGRGVVPGQVVQAGRDGIDIATGDGVLRITELQWPGGRRMDAAAAVNGHELQGRHFD